MSTSSPQLISAELLTGCEIDWEPERLVFPGPWAGHIPFAFWLVNAAEPRLIVELGTHTGNSYFSFCQAVDRLGLSTETFAIDTWRGDEHAGHYNSDVYSDVFQYNQLRYSNFSRLLRMTFDDARVQFDSRKIDILHIDGMHTYEAVRHDFKTWRDAMSDRGVIVFHDTNVRERDFGVWKLWSELSREHPSFEFLHSNGLGVLGVGRNLPDSIVRFLQAGTDQDATRHVRRLFAGKGEHLTLRTDILALNETLSALKSQINEIEASRNQLLGELAAGRAELSRRSDRDSLFADRSALAAELEELRNQHQAAGAEREALQADRDRLHLAYDGVVTSTSWKASAPFRKVIQGMSPQRRRMLRRIARAGWWIATPWRMRTRLRSMRAAGLPQSAGPLEMLTHVELDLRPHTIDGGYAEWVRLHDTLDDEDRHLIRRHIQALTFRPTISIVVPVYNTPETALTEMIASVRNQLYPHWELCIADDASPAPHVARILEDAARKDNRIKFVRRESNGHIAAASNSALELATGEFVALLDHDDVLAEHALYEVVADLNVHPQTDIIYSDEDKIDEKGYRYDPYFKPDFNIELLLGQNFVSHLGVYRRSVLESVGGFVPGTDGSQDYDLILRAVTAAGVDRVRHIPSVLYHWRQEKTGSSFSQTNIDHCVQIGRESVQRLLDNMEVGSGKAVAVPSLPQFNRVIWQLPEHRPLVSVIIPTRDRAELVQNCVEGLLRQTSYAPIEIIIVDNESIEGKTHKLFDSLSMDERISIIRISGPFNYSKLNNHAASQAKGDILLLLNNDIEVIESGWLNELVGQLSRPGVGIVGAKLIYGDGRVQHAGVRLGAGRSSFGPGIAGHTGQFLSRNDPGYFGQLLLAREVSAVTGACLAIRRDVYASVGGLDEDNLTVAFNDIDLCLRVREKGYRIVWTPFAELFHLESASRGSDATPEKAARFERECRYMIERWGQQLETDPFFSPSFDLASFDLRLAFPPRRTRPWDVPRSL